MDKVFKKSKMNIEKVYEAVINVENWKNDLSKITEVLEDPLKSKNETDSVEKSLEGNVSNFSSNLPSSNDNAKISEGKNQAGENFTGKKRQRNPSSNDENELHRNCASNDTKKYKSIAFSSDEEIPLSNDKLNNFQQNRNYESNLEKSQTEIVKLLFEKN